MSDDPRVYSDEEFALILRKATDLANPSDGPVSSSTGLTLTEMQAAAAQVGVDPALIERAARMLIATASASPLERLIGGPTRHVHEARFPIRLDENGAALLLSAVRISAAQAANRDRGHSSSMGMTWHDGAELDTLRVSARPERDGTVVSVALDRRGMFATVAAVSGTAMGFASLFAIFALYPEAPALGFGGLIAGIAGGIAVARGYWASSTRKVQHRISEVMDAIGQTLTQSETHGFRATKVGDGAVAPERDASAGTHG